jgi:hypothetical protein
MENSKRKQFLLILLLIGIAIFLWKKNQSEDNNNLALANNAEVNVNEHITEDRTHSGQQISKSIAGPQNNLVHLVYGSFEDKTEIQQKKLKEQFLAKIKLNIELPGNMLYEEVTLAEGVTGIHGIPQYDGGEEFLLLNNDKKNSIEDLKYYLNEEKESIPIVDNLDFSITDKVENVTLGKETGLDSANIILGYDKNDVQVFATLLNRSDGKGSYIIVLKGGKKFFEENEDRNFQLLSQLKATK